MQAIALAVVLLGGRALPPMRKTRSRLAPRKGQQLVRWRATRSAAGMLWPAPQPAQLLLITSRQRTKRNARRRKSDGGAAMRAAEEPRAHGSFAVTRWGSDRLPSHLSLLAWMARLPVR